MKKQITYKNETISINYILKGSGTPVLFLHGYLETMRMWDDVTVKLKDKVNSLVVDLPGHGGSGCLNEHDHGMDHIACIVDSLTNELGWDKFHIVGHSMGGYVSLEFLAKFPDKVMSITLFQSSCRADVEARKEIRDKGIAYIKRDSHDYTRETVYRQFKKNYNDFEIVLKALIESRRGPNKGLIKSLEGMKRRVNHANTLLDTDIPVNYYISKFDPVLPFESMMKEVEMMDPQKTYVDNKSGHMSQYENPKAVLKYFSSIFPEAMVLS